VGGREGARARDRENRWAFATVWVSVRRMDWSRGESARPPARDERGLWRVPCWLLVLVAVTSGCGGGDPPTIEAAPGELIAYTSGDGIHVVSPDGRKDWKVPGTGGLSGPRWAPDGRRFAAVDLGDSLKAYAVSLDGSEKQRLPADSSSTPDWSPDGTRLATFDEDDLRIHVVRVADGVSEAVIPKSGNFPAWSPDGRSIAFQGRDRDDTLRIFLAAPTGGAVTRLTRASRGDEGETGAAWSRSGRWIAFASDEDGDFDIYVVRADGSGPRKLTDNSVGDDSPSWSPDGSRLTFARTWPNKTAIVVYDLETGKEAVVAGGGLDVDDLVFAPSWQPAAG
jgi:Tol biopolymer transport system component